MQEIGMSLEEMQLATILMIRLNLGYFSCDSPKLAVVMDLK